MYTGNPRAIFTINVQTNFVLWQINCLAIIVRAAMRIVIVVIEIIDIKYQNERHNNP